MIIMTLWTGPICSVELWAQTTELCLQISILKNIHILKSRFRNEIKHLNPALLVHIISLTPPNLYWSAWFSQKIERSCDWLLEVSILSLFLRLYDSTLDLFRLCGMFCFSLYFTSKVFWMIYKIYYIALNDQW